MRLINQIFALTMLVSVTSLFVNCGGGGDDPKPKEQEQLEKLRGTWVLTSVTLDGTPREDFEDVTMTISGNYSNGGTYTYDFTGTFPDISPWPIKDPGSFKFNASSPETILERSSDGVLLNYTVDNSTLVISFTCTACAYAGGSAGRASEVNGNWVFTFTKQ